MMTMIVPIIMFENLSLACLRKPGVLMIGGMASIISLGGSTARAIMPRARTMIITETPTNDVTGNRTTHA